MIGITEAKEITSTLFELAKRAATVEIQEKVMELREFIVDLREQNTSLKEENHSLNQLLENKSLLKFDKGVYWREADETPFCQRCHDSEGKLIRLQDFENRLKWRCLECEKYYTFPEFRVHVTNYYT